jgi:hypothetical protein
MRELYRAGLALLCAAALAGCWPAPGQGPDRRADNPFETAITPATAASLTPQWATDTGDAAAGAPVVSPGAVHVTTGDTLRTLASSDGAPRWSVPGLGAGSGVSTMSDPIVRDRQVAVGSGFGNLGGSWDAAWYDAGTGAVASTFDGGLVNSLRGGTAALTSVGFGSGGPFAAWLQLVSFDGTGPNWKGLVHISTTGAGIGPATLGTDGVFLSGPGATVRRYPLQPDTTSCNPPGSPGLLCPTWTRTLDGTATAPVLGDGVVYVATGAGTLYALDPATGATQWSAAVGAAARTPAVARGHVYVPTADGDLVVLPAAGCGGPTCTPQWTDPTGSDLTVQPAVGGSVVVTGSADGSVKVFAADGCGAATCPALWTANAGSRVTGAPAVTGGRIYVGTQAGSVVAYGLD